MRSRLVAVAAVTLTVGACSIEDGGGEGRATVTDTSTTTTTSVASTPTTTVPGSVGIVELAGTAYEITADCYAPGAGELVATGIAMTDVGRVEVYVQAFVGQPYVGITVVDGDGSVQYEPAVDRPLDITLIDDVIRVDDVALVTDLDLDSGVGVDAGVGTVVIECRSYDDELPPGFAGE